MKQYSEKFKEKMIEKLLMPPGRSASELAKETGVSQSTLSRWMRDSVEAVAKAPKQTTKRRSEKWTLREKMRVVEAAEGLGEEEIGALIRREGILLADLEEWRRLGDAEDVERPLTREEKQRVKKLEKELRRKDKALAEAAALLVLQKKLRTILGDEDDDTKPKDED